MKSTKKEHTEIEGTIRNLLKQTIGKQKIRTDKIPKPKSSAKTQARKEKKTAKRRFEEACRTKSEKEKIIEKEKYQQTQRTLRSEIEKHERENIEKRLKTLQNRAKKDPNIILQARKKVRRKTELDYNIITKDDRVLTCPEETKNHVAEYFKDLYQARIGTPEYDHWTQLITDTVQQATEKNTTNHHQPRQWTNKQKGNKQSHKKTEKKEKRRTRWNPERNIHRRKQIGKKHPPENLQQDTLNRGNSPQLAKGRNNPAEQRKREKRKML